MLSTMSAIILRERFAAIGFPRVEATSCSNSKVVPQFSDASRADQVGGTGEQPPIPSVTGKQPERGRAVAQAPAHRRNRAASLALN